jgi:hypothetical protein
MLTSVGLALWAAVAMTFGDWFWAAFHLQHKPTYGLVHGLLLCAWIGLYLGWRSGRLMAGMVLTAVVGLLAAASFYALVSMMGYSAMFVSWVGLWFGLAWVAERVLTRASSTGAALLRGLLAAIGSGLAFYAVSDIWMHPPRTPNYAWNFVVWCLAFLPGALALLAPPRLR